MLRIRKFPNGVVSLGAAEIHSDNDYDEIINGANDSTIMKPMENWYKCNHNTSYMLGTIKDAYVTCRNMSSTIKTFYSQVSYTATQGLTINTATPSHFLERFNRTYDRSKSSPTSK